MITIYLIPAWTAHHQASLAPFCFSCNLAIFYHISISLYSRQHSRKQPHLRTLLRAVCGFISFSYCCSLSEVRQLGFTLLESLVKSWRAGSTTGASWCLVKDCICLLVQRGAGMSLPWIPCREGLACSWGRPWFYDCRWLTNHLANFFLPFKVTRRVGNLMNAAKA